jgi:hypothetical protein
MIRPTAVTVFTLLFVLLGEFLENRIFPQKKEIYLIFQAHWDPLELGIKKNEFQSNPQRRHKR